ncbi:MAG: hypothetical protein LBR07_02270 [Puniceicoccales bacterium]|jgi:putative hemin transport protein|nr:hypothetical protein [Puniceicoccales bacterium]
MNTPVSNTLPNEHAAGGTAGDAALPAQSPSALPAPVPPDIRLDASPEVLRSSWEELKKQSPRLYLRDAARRLGVSEAQLIALDAGVLSFRLAPERAEGGLIGFLRELAALGGLFIIIRNDNAVFEVVADTLRLAEGGGYINGFVGTAGEKNTAGGGEKPVAGGGFADTHFHLRGEAAAHVFAVHAIGHLQRGVQIFDAAGVAVIKFYLRDNALRGAFDAWSQRYRSEDQSPTLARR